MKKKLLVISVAVACLAIAAAGTAAYFTAEEKAHNVITTGGVEIQLSVEKGCVIDAMVYSDAIEGNFIASIPPLITGCKFDAASLSQALSFASASEEETILADIRQLIEEEIK